MRISWMPRPEKRSGPIASIPRRQTSYRCRMRSSVACRGQSVFRSSTLKLGAVSVKSIIALTQLILCCAPSQSLTGRHLQRPVSARHLFNEALKLQPDNADALAGVATTYVLETINGYYPAGNEQRLQQAEPLLARA